MSKDAAIVFLSPLWVEAYGPGGSYNKFTGKDASRAVAKWSMAEEDLNDNLEDLSEAELNRLDTVFKKLYLEKYPKVGYVEGHEPNHEDNLTIGKNKNIELWVENAQF